MSDNLELTQSLSQVDQEKLNESPSNHRFDSGAIGDSHPTCERSEAHPSSGGPVASQELVSDVPPDNDNQGVGSGETVSEPFTEGQDQRDTDRSGAPSNGGDAPAHRAVVGEKAKDERPKYIRLCVSETWQLHNNAQWLRLCQLSQVHHCFLCSVHSSPTKHLIVYYCPMGVSDALYKEVVSVLPCVLVIGSAYYAFYHDISQLSISLCNF